jgi:hypothetical protein
MQKENEREEEESSSSFFHGGFCLFTEKEREGKDA